MKYDKRTIKAIKQSIGHHQDNIRRLKTLRGKFRTLKRHNYFCIERIKIYYDKKHCSLCELFIDTECIDCPLKITDNMCGSGNDSNKYSSWEKLDRADTKSQAIEAEQGMVKALKRLLCKP